VCAAFRGRAEAVGWPFGAGGHWLYHCRDGATFVGTAGWPELEAHPAAIDALRRENAGFARSAEQIEEYLGNLDKGGSPTAYLFRCRHCGTDLAYSDSD
jgi:uncharacterized protein CbrC (UPF0167 family)